MDKGSLGRWFRSLVSRFTRCSYLPPKGGSGRWEISFTQLTAVCLALCLSTGDSVEKRKGPCPGGADILMMGTDFNQICKILIYRETGGNFYGDNKAGNGDWECQG